ncbi:hypothetical protein K3495_g6901 [Podosphaera aphanis]|nr:hypothetical protein K3495_g6901 [Podosphaera aphanis]
MPDTTSETADRSYISAAVESLSPWGFRASSTKSNTSGDGSSLRNQNGGDRIVQQRHGPSSKMYPSDCPPLYPRWFYAIDVPKRKPKLLNINTAPGLKNMPAPKKFATFSEHDSQAIEAAYQQLADECSEIKKDNSTSEDGSKSPFLANQRPNTSLNEAGLDEKAGGRIRIPVQEDFLFDVDIERRELSPVYWLGPIYEVRRGSWFYQEGTNLRPCEENLSAQLEEGYLKIKPFRYPKVSEAPTSASKTPLTKTGDTPISVAPSVTSNRQTSDVRDASPQESTDDLKTVTNDTNENYVASPKDSAASAAHQPQTYRLFGTYMNTVVTYIDTTVAWLSVDSIMSRVSSTVYQKFAGGGYLGGVKLVRGYVDLNKTKDSLDKKGFSTAQNASAKNTSLSENPISDHDKAQQTIFKRRSSPINFENQTKINSALASPQSTLNYRNNKESIAENSGRQDDNEIQADYNDRGDTQGRQIDHLILCTHGIGQRLGMRTETVNFVHDVNVLRQNIKNVYENSADLQALNSEIDKVPKNCRIQVLPICWRHLLDFPRKGEKQAKSEHDLGDALADEEEYPSLEDITIEGVPFVRSLITDLAVDILLFQSAYREHICNIVLTESNRIYNLFKERNPDFKGKVSLLGHSLGSAILFDLLSRQKENTPELGRNKQQNKRPSSSKNLSQDLEFLFEVEDFYCYGSPIGLFQMLKGQIIRARKTISNEIPHDQKRESDYLQDSFLAANSTPSLKSPYNVSTTVELTPMVSSPKVGRLYNIFHPSDPIAYRLEPLISPAMSSMKPQLLPYTKRSISSSMSGIGAKVGQSVSGILTSLSSGLASSLFNRSLGLTNDDIARMESPTLPRNSSGFGTGPYVSGSAVSDDPVLTREETSEKKKQLAESTAIADREGNGGVKVATLIDEDMETLYSGFQKARQMNQNSKDFDRLAAEEKGKRLKREEAKIRALNSNGRVDYSLQETFMDINPMNTIASHMSYWADEDISHFMMSQLLSRYRKAAPDDNERSRSVDE